MVAFRERTRRSVACVIYSCLAVAFVFGILVAESRGDDASPAFGLAAVALSVLALVWRDQ